MVMKWCYSFISNIPIAWNIGMMFLCRYYITVNLQSDIKICAILFTCNALCMIRAILFCKYRFIVRDFST
ncbi:hypothetical protein GLOIN_2v1669566 [Rhizophagus irregularis DAOM 181602=DAOM 197198]|uniref:Uncharacterized protein n=1 Tax=Rhizophagus irregularis (strain DAOM 181602 / DAOM 197198 / MUCL 43194) TaxID=747089 RepID=A0A2P4PI55_RHIID|nr:hypothetical protein GLOIN_2v1669566 [Rhizophagus irregularis DAOM 181602=DAOM 197198]POG65075.1 hypothetical protein GLOIN_2v1669566 [Rhizophagus irregularis DAOM 181602=DAOM 197198]|eukprot:XP_025171941.1 hypothetical protein GLOIN_2v1669566 [Rhizophagus irregularis DAOM 181602=DAOM 197198]